MQKRVIKLFETNFIQMKSENGPEITWQSYITKSQQEFELMSEEERQKAIQKQTGMFLDITLSLIRLTCRLCLDELKQLYLTCSKGQMDISGKSWLKFIESTKFQEWLHLQASLVNMVPTFYGANARFGNFIGCPQDCEEYPVAHYIVKITEGALETLDEGWHGTTIATLCSYFIFKLLFPEKECVVFMDEGACTISHNLEFEAFD